MSRLRAVDLLRVSTRLAFLQATWCEGSMQSEGLGYCLVPGLARICADRRQLNETLQRYRAPFNTHPFLAGVVAGIVLNLEEQGANQKRISGFMRGTMGSLGAVGDPFFQSALAPAAAILACLAAHLAGPVAAVLTLLVAFNLLHMVIRIAGVYAGYRDGEVALVRVMGWMGASRTRLMRAAAAALGGVLLGVIAVGSPSEGRPWAPLVFGACAIGVSLLLNGRRSVWIYFASASLAVLLLLGAVL